MIRIPSEFVVLAVVAGAYYIHTARKRQKADTPRACFKLAALWSIWTLVGLTYAIMPIPPPPVPGEPILLPSPETFFLVAVYFVFLPALAVWILMMLDLMLYVLKRRYRFRAADQSESSQVEALPSL